MGIYNAISSAKSGLDAQGQKLTSVSNNVANLSTDGYKGSETVFSTLVTSAGSTTGSSNGGVLATDRQLVDQVGPIKSTTSATDLAISGNGFFVVSNTPNLASGDSNYLYTRKGSFTQDAKGNYINTSGYYLLAWPLDSQGRLPGDAGNINTVSSALLQSLQPVNLSTFTGAASATTQVSVGANLTSSLASFKGNGVNIKLPSFGNNANIDSDTIIDMDHNGFNALNAGDQLSFTPSTVNLTYNYSYDGIAGTSVPPGIVRSNLVSSLTPVLGADTPENVFNTGVAVGDNFSITNETGGTVTFTFVPNSPDANKGEFNSMSSLASAIKRTKGLTARINNADNGLLVSTLDGNESLTFTNNQGSFVTALGLTNTLPAPNQNRFTTLRGLLNLTKSSAGLNGTLSGANGNMISITPSDPTGIVTVDAISGGGISTGFISSPYSIASEFGINTTLGLTNTIPNSGQDIALGFLPTSTNNNGIDPRDVIDIDNSGLNILNSGDTLTFASSQTATTPVTLRYDGTAGVNGIARSNDVTGTILGATTATAPFTTGIANGDTITITVGGTPYAFTFQDTSPDMTAGEFNSMETLAQAINTMPASSTILSSRLNQANNQLLITPLDGTQAMTFASTPATIRTALGLNDTTANTTRFTTMQGLVDLINASTATSGVQADFDANNKIQITPVNTAPDSTVVSASATAVGLGNSGGISTMASIFGEFGISIDQGKSLSPSYDPTGTTAPNMASGNATPQFSRNVRIYDAFGTGHDFQISFLKTSPNIWAVEIYAVTPSELSNSANDTGQIAYGNVTFNGDGTLNSVSPSLYNPINISWEDQAINSSIAFNWGTAGSPVSSSGANTAIGKSDGLSQFDSAFNVSFVNQNGVPAGQLRSVNIDDSGLVQANFSNGTSKTVFQIPLAVFANPNGLSASAGNAYGQTNLSGEFNLKIVGSGGTGTISPMALEQSNVELSDQLTDTIIAQRGYQANAQVIKAANTMLDDLSRII